MVHLDRESIKQFESTRSRIMLLCTGSECIRRGIESFMNLSVIGTELAQVCDFSNLSYEICQMAANLTKDFGWRIPDKEYRQMVRDRLAPLPPLIQWLYAGFLAKISRDYPPERFIQEHLCGIDRTYHISEWVAGFLDAYNPKADYARAAENTVSQLHCDPLCVTFLMQAHDQLAAGDFFSAAFKVVEFLENDVLALAEKHAIQAAALYVTASLDKLTGIPNHLTMEGLKFFYLADDRPYYLYNESYLKEMDTYEYAPKLFRRSIGQHLKQLLKPQSNLDILTQRIRDTGYYSDSIAPSLPVVAEGTLMHMEKIYRYTGLPKSYSDLLQALIAPSDV